MKKGIITEITKVNERDGPHGKLYYINMKLDNWENISLWKKKADAFKVGDLVTYEDYIDGKGLIKQKEVKEELPKKSFNSESNNKGAMVGMAIKTAFETFYDPKKENFKETIALAHRIYEEALAMLNEMEEPKESAKDDALPF